MDLLTQRNPDTGNTELLIDNALLGQTVTPDPDTYARYVHVQIDRDPMEKQGTQVHEHEVPILREIHGEGKVHSARVVSQFFPINAGDEYERLRQRYGAREEDEWYVGIVYGNAFQNNLKALLDDVYRQAGGTPQAINEGQLGTAITVSREQAGDPDNDGEHGAKLPWNVRRLSRAELVSALHAADFTELTAEASRAELLNAYAEHVHEAETAQ